MNLRTCLYKAAHRIAVSQNSAFRVPVKKQKEFLGKLKEPENLLERSHHQYLCQRWMKSNGINFITDIVSVLLTIYYYLKGEDKISDGNCCNAVFIGMGLGTDVIPERLYKQYGKILNLDKAGEKLTKGDKEILKELAARYPLSFEFLLKCLLKTRIYRWVIDSYSPKAIIVSEEYSYTCSFLTYFCRKNGIKHINIMHGEKLFYIRDSFVEFDEFYVWDSYYKDLFTRLGASSDQFVIAVPPALILEGTYEKKYDYTYYLGGESEEQLTCILKLLLKLKSSGYKVAVRPHPRYSERRMIDRIFKGKADIQDIEKTPIKESVLGTQNVISLYSTVINQAVNSGVKAVIDDISDHEKYQILYELEYRFVSGKNVLPASELIKQIS